MKNQKYFLAGIAILVIAGAAYFYAKMNLKSQAPTRHPYDFAGACPGETIIMKMNDAYMRGVLELNQEYRLLSSWYWCNPVERDDLILLKFAQDLEPVVKKVYGVPGDKFKVSFDKAHGAWYVEIEGDKVEAEGKTYFFGANNPSLPPPLKLFEGSRKGILLEREIIVFSSFPPGNKDSGTLGVVNLNDVVGKVELIKN